MSEYIETIIGPELKTFDRATARSLYHAAIYAISREPGPRNALKRELDYLCGHGSSEPIIAAFDRLLAPIADNR